MIRQFLSGLKARRLLAEDCGTVKVALPVADGVPEITPADERVSPPGKVPVVIEKVIEPTPPLVLRVWL
jgi:hypothetical protein